MFGFPFNACRLRVAAGVVCAVVAWTSTAAAQDAAPPAAAEPAPTVVPAPVEETCEVVVMSLQARGLPESEHHLLPLLTTTMATEIAQGTGCKVTTEADVRSMLDFEATRLACGETDDSCIAEIGAALGVDLVVGGTVGLLGDEYVFQAALRNVSEGQVTSRVDRVTPKDAGELRSAVRAAARELFVWKTGAVVDVDDGDSQALFWVGAGITGLGVTTAVLGAGVALGAEIMLGMPAKPEQHETTLTLGRGASVVAVVGVVVGVAGAGILMWEVME